jgi:diguanylate cyclase (GGDEF)-like protein
MDLREREPVGHTSHLWTKRQTAVNFLANLEKRNKLFLIIVGFALIGVVGVLDFLTGEEFVLLLFYLIPISLVTWLAGRRGGMVASLASTFVSLVADVAGGHTNSQLGIYIWNTLIIFSTFVIFALLLSALRRAMDHERDLAHIDFLTGAVNSRFFFDLVNMEIYRSQRYNHPFTIVYLDLDNFKTVNDKFGHITGDQVLRAVANQARTHLRKTDVVARLGGDEFALLLPETNQESAQVVISKIQGGLLVEMQQSNWPVTFSIGVLTCTDAPPSPDELIRLADELMYSVKHGSKNAIKFSNYPG